MNARELTHAQRLTVDALREHHEAEHWQCPASVDTVPLPSGAVLAILTPDGFDGAPDPVVAVHDRQEVSTLAIGSSAEYLDALSAFGAARLAVQRESSILYRIEPGGTYERDTVHA